MSHETILAIDDNRDNLTALQAVLRDALSECVVLTTTSGPHGLELARCEDPDVILLDIVMPGMDGFEVCRRLKEDERLRAIPVVFLTALRTDRDSRIRALKVGADGFLSKPLDEQELVAQVRAMARLKVASRQQHLENEQLTLLVAERTRELERELAERKRAEAALRASEEHYRSLAENSPDLIARFDRTCRHLYVNAAAAKAGRHAPAEYVGLTMEESGVPGPDARKWEERIRTVLKTGMSMAIEDAFETPDGPRYYHTRFVPEFAPDGAVLSVQSVARDITERKRAEEALRKSEEEFRSLAEAMPQIVWATRKDGWNVYFNQRWVDYTGLSLEESYGHGWNIPFHPDDQQRAMVAWRNATSTGGIYSLECRLRRADGVYRWWLVRGVPLLDKRTGEILKWFGTCTDIEDIKRTEAYRAIGLETLAVLNEPGTAEDAIQLVLAVLKARTGFDAVGIRLQDGDDFPYITQQGFSKDFLLTENTLVERGADGGVCRDTDGNVCLECTCGLVISGKTNPSHPLFTRGGSFWTNDSTPLLDLPSDQDPRHRPRNQCIHLGYASVALVPIRDKDRIVGLIHLNDRRKGRFTLESVEMLEETAAHIGAALTRRQAEEALQQSERRFRDLSAMASEGTMVHEDFVILDANPAFAELLGYSTPGDLIGRNALEVTPLTPESRQRIQAHSRAGSTESYEVELVRPDGSLIPVETCAKWTTYRGCQARLVSMRDITERKRAEEAVRESERRFTYLVANTPAMIYTCRAQGDYGAVFVSDNIMPLLGYRPEEFLADPGFWRSHIHPEDLERVLAEVPKCLQGSDEYRHEYRFRRKDETYCWVHDRLRLIRDAAGQPSEMIGHMVDITERKQADADKVRLEARLQQAQKLESVGRLAGGVAHDFNNLLMGIINYVELCRDEVPPEHPVRSYLDEITRDAQRSADITRQLLAFARKQVIAPKVLDLNDALGGMLKMLRHLLGEDIAVNWMPGARLWPVKIDPGQLDQILVNLCINARDAIAGVGKVAIETANTTLDEAYCSTHAEAAPGEVVRLTVSDSGCGMGRDVLAHMFEPFYTTKEVGRGTGLGLATVYGIVEQNHGHIEVQSEVGKGTTFSIYLPRAVSEADTGPAAVTPERLPRGTETILLAEDEKSVRVTSRLFLEALGYTVLAAETPEEALRLGGAHSGPIHLLITDVIMPGMNGPDLAAFLAGEHPNLKCLFMSGYTADVIMRRGTLDAAGYFLAKPFSRHDLARKVREVLDGR